MKDKKVKVYDFLTIIFHWVFVILFVTAFIIAKALEDTPGFSYHMLVGLLLVFALILRVIWGFIGTRYARFNSFELTLKSLLLYTKALLKGKTKRYAGHNPASSYITLIMFVCVLGLGATGILMANEIAVDFFGEVHEILVLLLILSVVAHVLGVIFHSIKHKDKIAKSVITGDKEELDGLDFGQEQGIESKQPLAGLVYVILILLFGVYVYGNYDPGSRNLSFLGMELNLEEHEHDDNDEHGHDDDDEHEHKDDDD